MLRRLSFACVALTLSTGCGAQYSHHHHVAHAHGGSGGAVVFAAAVGLMAGAAIASSNERPVREEPVVIERTVYVGAPPPAPAAPPASDRDRVPPPEEPGFPAHDARTALGNVDLSECRAAGAPRGHGHAKVTFNPDGAVSKVVVDTPDGLPDAAVQCIGGKLGAVTIAEYKGSLVTVGTSWFIP